MKPLIQTIVAAFLLLVIAADAGAQEEQKPAAAAFDYRKILSAAYAQEMQQPAEAPAPPAVKEERRSGQGPEYLPPTVQGAANDLPSDADFEARRAAGNAPKLRVVPKPPRDFSLEALSQFLGDAESSVILPKGSVIHCPEALTARLLTVPRGKLMDWQEFLVAHRAWITTREVSQEQIRGEAAFTEIDRSAFHKGGKLVVATFRGHPVTVLSPAVPTPP